jgi:hypothetical protein
MQAVQATADWTLPGTSAPLVNAGVALHGHGSLGRTELAKSQQHCTGERPLSRTSELGAQLPTIASRASTASALACKPETIVKSKRAQRLRVQACTFELGYRDLVRALELSNGIAESRATSPSGDHGASIMNQLWLMVT